MELIPIIRVEDTDDVICITDTHIRKAFDIWRAEQIKYRRLREYYLGMQNFEKTEGAYVVNNMCKYTVDAILGFMTGHPIGYSCPDDTNLQSLVDHHLKNRGQSQDADMIKCMSIFGRGYRLVYHDDDSSRTPKSTVLDPTQAFVCYTGTVEPRSLFGATVTSTINEKGTVTFYLTVYTDREVQKWMSHEPVEVGGVQTFVRLDDPEVPTLHKFGRVPLVEYRNSLECMGDFEQIMSLQDAYNAVMSDRIDDKNAFAEAMLLIQGSILGLSPDEIKENSKEIKNRKVIQTDEDAKVEWLTKTLNEADTQVLADSLMANMHKLAKVPNLADSEFSQNASGVAMQYKLYGTDLLAAEKEKYFIKSQMYYFKCLDAGFHNNMATPDYKSVDVSDIKITFKHTVPSDLSYEASTLATLKATGLFSDDTLRSLASFIEDTNSEKLLVEAQQKLEEEREKRLYSDEFGLGKTEE